jgi:CheY-like chemotaxis protein/MinD-like ATPase involved in chromosome partitioning or flagellar assembly
MAAKILIVDDDPNALRLVSYGLQTEGYEVTTAASGSEALARLASEKPDLIILDVMMPDMSGLEVCERIRANETTTRLPILMLSARGRVADRVTGLKSGADDYLPKPADTSELAARVGALLARASYASQPMGQVLAFIGAKGGVGTTTVAANVAAHIASRGKSVCLAELRPGAGVAAHILGLQPLADLGDLLARPLEEIGRQEIHDHLIPHASGLRLLAAPRGADGPCEITAGFVALLLQHLRSSMDYVLLDLPAAWSGANRAAVEQARFTAVLGEPGALALQCVKATLATLQRWRIMGDLVGLVLVNHGTSETPLLPAKIRAEAQANLVAVIPPMSDAGRSAVATGSPIVSSQPQHTAAVALRELGERLMVD